MGWAGLLLAIIVVVLVMTRKKKPKKKFEPKDEQNPSEIPPWHDIAATEMANQIKEIPGEGSNPRIEEYHKVTTIDKTDDDVPWCSSFVSWCLENSHIMSTRSAWARSYLYWGVELDKPQIGAIVVLSRGPSSGHVGFFVAYDDEYDEIILLGGNQDNKVGVNGYPKSKVLGFRWPSEGDLKEEN